MFSNLFIRAFKTLPKKTGSSLKLRKQKVQLVLAAVKELKCLYIKDLETIVSHPSLELCGHLKEIETSRNISDEQHGSVQMKKMLPSQSNDVAKDERIRYLESEDLAKDKRIHDLEASYQTLMDKDVAKDKRIKKMESDSEKLYRLGDSLKVRGFYVALRKAIYLRVLPTMIENLSEESKLKGHIWLVEKITAKKGEPRSTPPQYHVVMEEMKEQIAAGKLNSFLASVGIHDSSAFFACCENSVSSGRVANAWVHLFDAPLEEAVKTRDFTKVTFLAETLMTEVYRKQSREILVILKSLYPPK